MLLYSERLVLACRNFIVISLINNIMSIRIYRCNKQNKNLFIVDLLLLLVGVFMPVFTCASEVWAETPGIFYLPLEKSLQQYIDDQPGAYGLFVTDIETWSSFGINANEKFIAASTVKLPVALYVMHLVGSGKLSLTEELEYKEKHKEGGTGYLQREEFGTRFSVSRLLKDSIIYSDNVAVNMLLDRVGRKNTKEYMRRMGGRVVDDVENVTCPIDMALYMARALAFTREHPQLGGQLIDYLFNTVYNQRIPAPLPKGVRVAHKIGNWPLTGTFNDVGYVEHPENPYIIAILSKDTPGREQAFRVIRRISKEVYDYLSNPYFCAGVMLNEESLDMGECALFQTRESGAALELLVPLRSFVEALPGLKLYWLEETKQIVVEREYPAKRLVYKLYGGGLKIINDKSYIPASQLALDLDYTYTWDAARFCIKFEDKFNDLN